MNQKDKDNTLPENPPKEEIRCPRLGHQIGFSYCEHENNGLPCFKTLDCWHNYFKVHDYLKGTLSVEDFKKTFLETGKPKVFSLMDLIEQAKKNKDKGKPD
jgi:hypothetical protein